MLDVEEEVGGGEGEVVLQSFEEVPLNGVDGFEGIVEGLGDGGVSEGGVVVPELDANHAA